MSKKSGKIARLIQNCHGQTLDAHYLGFFHCFNQQLFYEAHDVLEELWLAQRHGSNDAFYKGLIQLAGAFVHLQKNRLRPAGALLKLARANLQKYPSPYQQLDISVLLELIDGWIQQLERNQLEINPLTRTNPPRLKLNN